MNKTKEWQQEKRERRPLFISRFSNVRLTYLPTKQTQTKFSISYWVFASHKARLWQFYAFVIDYYFRENHTNFRANVLYVKIIHHFIVCADSNQAASKSSYGVEFYYRWIWFSRWFVRSSIRSIYIYRWNWGLHIIVKIGVEQALWMT